MIQRERERERKREREKERERERETDRQTDRQIEIETEKKDRRGEDKDTVGATIKKRKNRNDYFIKNADVVFQRCTGIKTRAQ